MSIKKLDPSTIVKLNDKLFEVKVDPSPYGNSGVTHRELSDEEIVEYELLVKSEPVVDLELQEQLNSLVKDVTENLKKSFSQNLRSTVLKSLGFEAYNNSIEIKIGNYERLPIVAKLIQDEVRAYAVDEIKKNAFELTKAETDKIVKAAHDEFKKNLDWQVRKYAREILDAKLKEKVAQEISTLLGTQEINIEKTIADVLRARRK